MNDYESTVSRKGWEGSVSGRKPQGGILAAIHLLDGRTIDKRFMLVEYKQYADIVSPEHELLRVWMEHTNWIETGPNEFVPMSQVLKITWTEIPPEQ